LPIRSNDAKLVLERLTALHRRAPPSFNRRDILRMHPVAKIRVRFYTSVLESKDGLKLGCARNPTGAEVPIPDANARSQLGQPKPLLALAQRVLGPMTFDNFRSLSHIQIEQTQVLIIGFVHRTEMGRQRA